MKIKAMVGAVSLLSTIHLTAAAYVVPPDFFDAFMTATHCDRKGGDAAITENPQWGWYAIADCKRGVGNYSLLVSAEKDQFAVLADSREALQAAESEFGITPEIVTESGRGDGEKFVVVTRLSALPKVQQLAKTFKPPKIVRVMCMPSLPNMGGMNALLAGTVQRPGVFNFWYSPSSQILYEDKAGTQEIKKYSMTKDQVTVNADEDNVFRVEEPSGALRVEAKGLPVGAGECSALDGIYTLDKSGRGRYGKMKI